MIPVSTVPMPERTRGSLSGGQTLDYRTLNAPNLTETIINLETVNPIEFFGVNNGKLDILKKKFPLLKILSRGTQIKLSGSPEQVETAKEKIDL